MSGKGIEGDSGEFVYSTGVVDFTIDGVEFYVAIYDDVRFVCKSVGTPRGVRLWVGEGRPQTVGITGYDSLLLLGLIEKLGERFKVFGYRWRVARNTRIVEILRTPLQDLAGFLEKNDLWPRMTMASDGVILSFSSVIAWQDHVGGSIAVPVVEVAKRFAAFLREYARREKELSASIVVG